MPDDVITISGARLSFNSLEAPDGMDVNGTYTVEFKLSSEEGQKVREMQRNQRLHYACWWASERARHETRGCWRRKKREARKAALKMSKIVRESWGKPLYHPKLDVAVWPRDRDIFERAWAENREPFTGEI